MNNEVQFVILVAEVAAGDVDDVDLFVLLVDLKEHSLDRLEARLPDVFKAWLGTDLRIKEIVDKVERDRFRAVCEYPLEPLKEQLLVSLDIAVGDENVPELIELVLLDMREA